jgi:hypothetical protein
MNRQEVDAMTVQQAIEYSLDKLVKQGKRCMDSSNECAYGDGEGNHCAIGWLLDADNKGLMKLEGSVADLTLNYCRYVPRLIINNQETFNTYQSFHDAHYEYERIKHRGKLESLGIDTSHPNFQAWIDLGELRQQQ